MRRVIERPGGTARVLAAVIVLLLSLATAGVSPQRVAAAQPPTGGTFVGHVDSDTFIGVVIGDGEVIAFVCDGTGNGLTTSHWAWFRGPIGGAQTEVWDGEGNSLRFGFVDGVLRGDVRLGSGLDTSFSLVPADGPAGIYRAEGTIGAIAFVGGWIVLNDLDVRGAVQITGIMAEPMTSRYIEQDNFSPTTATVNLLGASITATRVTLR